MGFGCFKGYVCVRSTHDDTTSRPSRSIYSTRRVLAFLASSSSPNPPNLCVSQLDPFPSLPFAAPTPGRPDQDDPLRSTRQSPLILFVARYHLSSSPHHFSYLSCCLLPIDPPFSKLKPIAMATRRITTTTNDDNNNQVAINISGAEELLQEVADHGLPASPRELTRSIFLFGLCIVATVLTGIIYKLKPPPIFEGDEVVHLPRRGRRDLLRSPAQQLRPAWRAHVVGEAPLLRLQCRAHPRPHPSWRLPGSRRQINKSSYI